MLSRIEIKSPEICISNISKLLKATLVLGLPSMKTEFASERFRKAAISPLFIGVNFELERLRDVSEKEKALKAEIAKIDKRKSGVNELEVHKTDTVSILKELVDAKSNSKKIFFTDLLITTPDTEITKEVSKEEALTFFQKLFASNRSVSESELAGVQMLEDEPLFAMELKMEVFSDFEGAYRLIEEFNKELYKSGRFMNIVTEPPKDELETIVPEIAGVVIELTREQWREFKITADLNIEKK